MASGMSMKASTVALEGHRHHKRRPQRSYSSSDSCSSSDDERGAPLAQRAAAAGGALAAPASRQAQPQDVDGLLTTLYKDMERFGATVASIAKVNMATRRGYGAVIGTETAADEQPTSKSQFVATATIKQRFNESKIFDADLGRPVLRLAANKNLELEFDQPEIGEKLRNGELSAVIEKLQLTLHARDPEDLDITFPGIKTAEGTPLKKTITMGQLVKGEGTVTITPIDRPFSEEKLQALEDNAAYLLPGNLAKTYTRVEALGFAAVPLDSPIGRYVATVARDEGKEDQLVVRKHLDKAHLEVDLHDFDTIHEPATREFFMNEFPLADLAKFEIHISPQPYRDDSGKNPMASFNHDNPGGEVLLNGECKITLRTLQFADSQ